MPQQQLNKFGISVSNIPKIDSVQKLWEQNKLVIILKKLENIEQRLNNIEDTLIDKKIVEVKKNDRKNR